MDEGYRPSYLGTMFFLFSGKSYAIFSLLFGFTYYVQLTNQQKKGGDFAGRFAWRLVLLLVFGIFNSIFFEGDILAFYAILGIMLIPVRNLSSTVVLVIAIFLMLQPVEWAKFFYILNHPDYVASANLSDAYFGRIGAYLGGGTFWEAAKGNLWNGRLAVIFWSWENGRFFQTVALFMLGMLLGRQGRFNATEGNHKFWITTLIVSAVSFGVLFTMRESLHDITSREALIGRLWLIVGSLSNFAFMMVWVSLFGVFYQKRIFHKIFSTLIPLGRMSLSNYVMQSIAGALVYYNFGLGLYKYTGATYCLLIGIVLAILQLWFCKWWLKTHNQGPLEFIWHKATWVKLRKTNN